MEHQAFIPDNTIEFIAVDMGCPGEVKIQQSMMFVYVLKIQMDLMIMN